MTVSEPTPPPTGASTAPTEPAESGRIGLLGAIDNAAVPMLLTRLALGGTFLFMGIRKTGYPLDTVKHIKI